MTCEVFVSDGPGKEFNCTEEAVALLFNFHEDDGFRVCCEHSEAYGPEVRSGMLMLEPIRS